MDSRCHADSKSLLSSSSARRWKYDVFLSFRGPDTRKGITSNLHHRLNIRGIKTFMDDRNIEVGDVISPTLLAAIEESRFAIIILSPDYASSPWCLEEVTKICQCMEYNNRILPLFFGVKPAHVKHQTGSFQKSFTNHENSGRHKSENVQQWREALTKVANCSGWELENYKTEIELVEDIVKDLYKLQPIEINMGDFEEFDVTREAMNKVMKALEDDEVTAVAVHGMGGVGKTTMVKHIGAQARKNDIFDHLTMAVVSQRPDLKKIQGTLAEQLGLVLTEEAGIVRADRLSKEIMGKTKILIILDNVWDRIELSDIGIPSYKELKNCNSKVLLTTRMEHVCHVMDCQERIFLNVLSGEASWTLFVRNARRSFESTNFEDVARKVARECGGLPIALIAVARALGDKQDPEEWKSAAQRLEKSETASPHDKGVAFECIKLSYDYLQNENYKACFLLCCLFPENYNIRKEDLFRYAIGKGLFRDDHTIQEARRTVDSVVDYLKDSSLLLECECGGHIRMHEVTRDTAIQIAQSKNGHGFFVKAGWGLKKWPCPLHESYSAVSLMENEICNLEELVCQKLQILLLQENANLNEIPENFIQSENEIRVLDISHTNISLLPQSFSLLTNLQALYLDFCEKITNISTLGKLKKLEILSMRGYPLQELLIEFGQLTNLRMLDVSSEWNGGIVRIPSEVISKLHRLEELYMQFGFWNWGSKVEGDGEATNVGFDEVTRLPHLNILKVCISDENCIPKMVGVYPNWMYFDIRMSRDRSTGNINQVYQSGHKCSKSLILDTTIDALPTWFVKVVTENTEKLQYIKCKRLKNILMEYKHGNLSSLKHLSVIGPNKSLEVLMDASTWDRKEPVFENLEELHLESMDLVKQLCDGELPFGSLRNLKVLKVHGCPKLENILLPSKLLETMPNLEKLICKCLPQMEYVFGCQGFKPKQTKLRQMMLLELDSVRSICYSPAPCTMFQTLTSLYIYRCKFRGSVFSYDAAQCLFQLEDLFVGSCPLVERVIGASKETVNNKKTLLPNLRRLGFEKLPVLTVSSTIDIKCPELEYLYVKECPKFSASAFDFQSKNQVKLNDNVHYTVIVGTRLFEEAQNPKYALDEKMRKLIAKMMLKAKKMSKLMRKKWLEIAAKVPVSLENMPKLMKFMEGMPKFMEKMPKFADKMREFMNLEMDKMPELMDKMPELMDKMPEFMDKMLELVDNMPEFMDKMLELTDNMPQFWTMMDDTMPYFSTTVDNMAELMDKTPELMVNTPNFIDRMTELMANMPEFKDKLREMENLVQSMREPVVNFLRHFDTPSMNFAGGWDFWPQQ